MKQLRAKVTLLCGSYIISKEEGYLYKKLLENCFKQNNHLPTHSSQYSSLKKGGEISLDHAFSLLIFLGGVPKAGWLIIKLKANSLQEAIFILL